MGTWFSKKRWWFLYVSICAGRALHTLVCCLCITAAARARRVSHFSTSRLMRLWGQSASGQSWPCYSFFLSHQHTHDLKYKPKGDTTTAANWEFLITTHYNQKQCFWIIIFPMYIYIVINYFIHPHCWFSITIQHLRGCFPVHLLAESSYLSIVWKLERKGLKNQSKWAKASKSLSPPSQRREGYLTHTWQRQSAANSARGNRREEGQQTAKKDQDKEETSRSEA